MLNSTRNWLIGSTFDENQPILKQAQPISSLPGSNNGAASFSSLISALPV
jgi:hypothetical protein